MCLFIRPQRIVLLAISALAMQPEVTLPTRKAYWNGDVFVVVDIIALKEPHTNGLAQEGH